MSSLETSLIELKTHLEHNVNSHQTLLSWITELSITNSLLTTENYQFLLNSLVKVLLDSKFTSLIAQLFRPLLIELVSRAVIQPSTSRDHLDTILSMFALLLPHYPQLKPIFKTFLQTSPSPLDYYCHLSQNNYALLEENFENLTCTLTNILELLLFCSELVSHWDLSLCFEIIKSKQVSLAAKALKIIQLHNNLSEREARQLVEPEIYSIAQNILLETCSVTPLKKDVKTYEEWDISSISPALSPRTTLVGNLLVYKYSKEIPVPPTLVYVPTTLLNIREILLALSMEAPVLIEGTTGVGKTAIVEEVARAICKPDLIKIHLGDQTDSKALLGAYVATSTPGQFRWQMGVLTKAVKFGHWVLIEDIDLAPQEVISVIVPLLENRTLFIPSRGEQIQAAEGFQLFATRQTHSGSTSTSSSDKQIAGGSFWTKIFVHPLCPEELCEVVSKRFPSLSEFASQIVEVYLTMVEAYTHPESIQVSALRIGRPLTTRDLIKWCTRITSLENLSLPLETKVKEDIFSEAVDCFCGMLSDPDTWAKVLSVLGDALDISSQRVQHFSTSHAPALLNDNDSSFKVGRVILNKIQSSHELQLLRQSSSLPFAFTKHALRLLERIASCVKLSEPTLLVGETGTGKTTVVQNLARLMNQQLIAVNLSQQSDSSDLLGGFKPVDGKTLAIPLYETFTELFKATFSESSNTEFLSKARKFFAREKWDKLALIFKSSTKEAKKLRSIDGGEPASKQTRTISHQLSKEWMDFESQVLSFEAQADKIHNKLMFSFIEGSLVKAVRRGYWVLLDEINLATTETLECLSELLQDAEGSLLLTEKGDTNQIKRHPNFRVFACMNPATDVGKRDLPPGLRNRFTEFFVQSPDSNTEDLTAIVKGYLSGFVHGDESAILDVVEFYQAAKSLQMNRSVADGANQIPHYSVRTLSRALTYVRQIISTYGLRRSLYEGLCMTFATQLTKGGSQIVIQLAAKHALRPVNNIHHLLSLVPTLSDQESCDFVQYGAFWLPKGIEPIDPNAGDHYVITPSVKENLHNLARVVMGGKYPVLIQGPTSSGKTSMVEYLAKCTGHRFVRINNHEHTDLQEYIGSYVSIEGRLVFQEGALVTALRKGHWIVLDELNLAPSDVLEALNRLLDDNRELLISETQEVVTPHPHFMLFATQNPAGLYGGRKALSRAFRNRFLELHFDDIPGNELETILNRRCSIAPSYCKKLVQVYHKLQERRQATRVFESKEGFITLRDLFRWAGRQAVGYDELATHGYMLLAERVRNDTEKLIVKETLEEVMKVSIDLSTIYNCDDLPEFKAYSQLIKDDSSIAWTKAMQRLFSLVAACLRNNEPVLLVGSTGCGKTTVCQMLAAACQQRLRIVNCHQNTETSDLLGSQRPLRNQTSLRSQLEHDIKDVLNKFDNDVASLSSNDLISRFESLFKQSKDCSPLWIWAQSDSIPRDFLQSLLDRCYHINNLFEWHDGPLVESMKEGGLFLLDEISLAEDSVLERLNSVLEPSRLLVLAEKGSKQVEELYASSSFQFLATMNPGGDFGKKELSPALRNRFTEIWVPPVTDTDDLSCIIKECLSSLSHEESSKVSSNMLSFLDWFKLSTNPVISSSQQVISLRDILSWAQFIADTHVKLSNLSLAFVHGGCLVFLDGLGSNSSLASGSANDPKRAEALRLQGLSVLLSLTNHKDANPRDFYLFRNGELELDLVYCREHVYDGEFFGLGPFTVSKDKDVAKPSGFALEAPTSFDNMRRVLRALQISKPVMLEGSPGVGKTSLIQALADKAGRHLVRINLSEQTDLMDLFGTDLPVEGGRSGEFAWRDAPFLQAMRQGWWVLLDEINLASQSVLEGLNSVLDHRGSVYLPELGRSFEKAPNFQVFAAQNPQQQGGGRKGLPRSFLNRFAQVYVQPLSSKDLLMICKRSYPHLDPDMVSQMLRFNSELHDATMVHRQFGRQGHPWEFNLRDVFRWMDLLNSSDPEPSNHLEKVYLQRMRTSEDRSQLLDLYRSIFGRAPSNDYRPSYTFDQDNIYIGQSCLKRKANSGITSNSNFQLFKSHLASLEAVMTCINQNWMSILIGSQGTGKTSLLRGLAQMTGNTLIEFAMNPGVDTIELLGGFEQVEPARYRQLAKIQFEAFSNAALQLCFTISDNRPEICHLLKQITDLRRKIITIVWDEATPELLEQHVKQVPSLLANFSKHHINIFVLEEAYQRITKAIADFSRVVASDVGGRFEWIEGALIDAMHKGHWFLIDNANQCHASVLDRLNPLLEPNGALMLHERGLDSNGNVRWVYPHPNFRIFLAMDPIHGELSRPMRNRGLEIVLTPQDWSANPYDLYQVVSRYQLSDYSTQLICAHNAAISDPMISFSDDQSEFQSGSPREFNFLCRWVSERLQRGSSFDSALEAALYTVYRKKLVLDYTNLTFPWIFKAPPHKFLGHDMVLFSVLSQGAVLLSLASSSVNDFVSWDSQFESAGLYFIQRWTPVDVSLRLQFLERLEQLNLSHVSRHLAYLKFILSSLSELPLSQDLFSTSKLLWFSLFNKEFPETLSPIDIEKLQPINSSSSLTKKAQGEIQTYNTYNCLVSKYKVAALFFKLLFVINQSVGKAESKMKGHSILEYSYLATKTGALPESSNVDLIRGLYPFILATQLHLSQWLTSPVDETSNKDHKVTLINHLGLLVNILNSEQLEHARLVSILAWIKKSLAVDDAPSSLLTQTRALLQLVDQDTHRAMKSIWKHLSYPTLKSHDLQNLKSHWSNAFSRLDQFEDVTNSAVYDPYPKRQLLIDASQALASFHLLDPSTVTYQPALDSAASILNGLVTSMDSARSCTSTNSGSNSNDFVDCYFATVDHISLTTEADLIATLFKLTTLDDIPSDGLVEKLQSWLSFNFQHSSRTITDFTAVQNILWILERRPLDEIMIRGFLIQQLLAWSQRSWCSSFNRLISLESQSPESEEDPTDGPSRLFQSTETLATLKWVSSFDTFPLIVLTSQSLYARKLTSCLLTRFGDRPLVIQSGLLLFIGLLTQLLQSFSKDLPENTSDLLQSISSSLNSQLEKLSVGKWLVSSHSRERSLGLGQMISSINRLDELLLTISSSLLSEIIHDYIRPAISEFRIVIVNLDCPVQTKLYSSYGLMWIYIALGFLNSFIPTYPYDPVIKIQMKTELLVNQIKDLESNCTVHHAIQGNYNGAITNQSVCDMENSLIETKSDLAKLHRLAVPRPSKSQINEIFHELDYLKTNLINPTNTRTLIHELKTGNSSTAKEKVLQSNFEAFARRLQYKYPLYSDILKPIELAIQNFRHGIRYCVYGSSQDPKSNCAALEALIQHLLVYPYHLEGGRVSLMEQISQKQLLTQVKSLFMDSPTPARVITYGNLLSVLGQRLLVDISVQGWVSPSSRSHFEAIFAEICQLWSAVEERRQIETQENESLFKTKVRTIEGDEDDTTQLNNEIARLFPLYEEDFGDSDTAPIVLDGKFKEMDPEWIRQIVLVHQRLAKSTLHGKTASKDIKPAQMNNLLVQSYTLSSDLLKYMQYTPSYYLDAVLTGSRALVTFLGYQQFSSTVSSTSTSETLTGETSYNFYRSPNFGEAQKVIPVINKFKADAISLLEHWPEHAVLLELVDIADRMINLSSNSPIMKLLTGLELLLRKAQEWEAYSSKQYSLSQSLSEASALIIQWRRLELGSWPTLLNSIVDDFEASANKWWLHLYSIMLNPISNSTCDRNKSVLDAIDQFMRSSNIGEFGPRLTLLLSFANHLESRSLSPSFSEPDSQLLIIVKNIYDFYVQFLPTVEENILSSRKPIEKELKDLVKIASWKDVNVDALRQSAQKSHRNLTRLTRKFRDSLIQPIITIINSIQSNVLDKSYKSNELPHESFVRFEFILPDHGISRLSVRGDSTSEALFKKFQKLFCEDIYRINRSTFTSPVVLETFMTDILSQVQSFQSETIPADKDERVSYIKTRRMIKKKALGDLWKQFKKMGLRYRLSVRRDLQPGVIFHLPSFLELDDTWSFSQTLIDGQFGSIYGTNQDALKAQFYYQRVLARLPYFKQCAHQPSPDISLPEVERFLGYLDDMCHLVQQQRGLLFDLKSPLHVVLNVLSAWSPKSEESHNIFSKQLCEHLQADKEMFDAAVTWIGQTLQLLSIDLQLSPSDSLTELSSQLRAISSDLSIHQSVTNAEFSRLFVLPGACHSNFSLASDVTSQVVDSNKKFFIQLQLTLASILSQYSDKSCLVISFSDKLNEHLNYKKSYSCADIEFTVSQQLDAIKCKGSRLVEIIQVAIQKLVKKSRSLHTTSLEVDAFGMSSQHLSWNHSHYLDIMKELDLKTVANILSDLQVHIDNLSQMNASKQSDHVLMINQLCPFVHQYFLITRQLFWEYLAFHKATTKLAYITCNLGITLFTQGFCLPSLDQEDSNDGPGEDGQTGTGIGEGEGDKDVSEEIENEDQVSGTQNEEKSNHDQSQNEKDKAMEMEEDFEGETEDREPEEEEETSNKDSDSENSEEDEMDDQIGSVDGEDEAVDEKIWGEDHPEEDSKEAEGGAETQSQEDDIVAKDEIDDDSQQDDSSKQDKPDEKPKDDPMDDSKEDPTDDTKEDLDDNKETSEDQEDFEEHENPDDTANQNADAPLDVPEGENLELPDDLDLELDDTKEDSMEDNDDLDNEAEPDTTTEPQPEDGDNATEDQNPDVDDSETPPGPEDHQDVKVEDDIDEDMDEGNNGEDHVQPKPESPLEETPSNVQPEASPLEVEAPPSRAEQPPSNDTMGVSGENGDLSLQTDGEPTEQDTSNSSNANQTGGASNPPPTSTSTQEASKENQADSLDQNKEMKPNPNRALADALNEWRQRLDATDRPEENPADNSEDDANDANNIMMMEDENQTFEFVENDSDAHDAEAVGTATEDQFKNSLAIPESKEIPFPTQPEPIMTETSIELPFLNEEITNTTGEPAGRSLVQPNLQSTSDSINEIKALNVPETLLTEMRLELEKSLSDWCLNQDPDLSNKCRELWAKYEYLTHDLALNLCEQLRLILEPTLASKLQGDYRTGKRLNMKRIIPYIASEFKKDKIWLRRTKPNQRQYQVMIAVDDSKSMAESHSVQLTFESLALVTRALHQLEVGTTSVVSFGERVRLLHPFDSPFTTDSGAQLLSRFTFSQNKTCMSTLLSNSLNLFEQARHQHSRDDLWQLQLILSDGLCEDHEALRAYLRRAEEQRVMVIFLIVDTKPKSSSLLKLQQVKYTTSPETGREEMSITKYLDSFPFRYYLILNQIDSLPHVLADALRQYFQLVKG